MITLVIALEEAAAGAVFGRAVPMLAHADVGGEHQAKPVPPEPDCLVADINPALR